jgi:hypothetical protein
MRPGLAALALALPVDGRFARYLLVASALVISVAGLLIVVSALAQMGRS